MRLQRMVCPYLGLSTAVGSFKGADLSVAQSDDLKNKRKLLSKELQLLVP